LSIQIAAGAEGEAALADKAVRSKITTPAGSERDRLRAASLVFMISCAVTGAPYGLWHERSDPVINGLIAAL
jgi:hypothetical protein